MDLSKLSDIQSADQAQHALMELAAALVARPGLSFAPLLPLLFNFKGKPLDVMTDYFVHEPVFKLSDRPQKQLLKASRQVGKTLGAGADCIVLSGLIPYFNTLVLHPQQAQSHEFSNGYISSLIKDSPLFSQLSDAASVDKVEQRSFGNGSTLYFRYIGDSAERIRGLPASSLVVDELQGHDLDHVEVAVANMNASIYKFERYSGTAKTRDNPLQTQWERSSQGVWVTRCNACNHWSEAEGPELYKMLGKDTIVCSSSKCGRPIDPRTGHYKHRRPERYLEFAGYNMPCPILPRTFLVPREWANLKRLERDLPPGKFANEYLGESYDSGAKLITTEEVKAAATVAWQEPKSPTVGHYVATTVGVDWGGKGKETAKATEEFISQTALAGAGLCGDGSVEIFWLWTTPYTASYDEEAQMTVQAASGFGAEWTAHDAGGGGDLRQNLMVSQGYPLGRLAPFTYTGITKAGRPIVWYQPPERPGARSSYSIDKTRSLGLLIHLIRKGIVRLPDYARAHQFLEDFQSLYEETTERPNGTQRKLIRRIAKRHDDVVHAINFAVMALFHAHGWPELAQLYGATGDEEE